MPQKPLQATPITPPEGPRPQHDARFVTAGESKSCYSLPTALDSVSPAGYRIRVSKTKPDRRCTC